MWLGKEGEQRDAGPFKRKYMSLYKNLPTFNKYHNITSVVKSGFRADFITRYLPIIDTRNAHSPTTVGNQPQT